MKEIVLSAKKLRQNNSCMDQLSQLKHGSHFAWTEEKRAQVLCILSEREKNLAVGM